MNQLLDTFGLLSAAMLEDPLLALAHTVTWLDPLWEMSTDDLDEEVDTLALALCITRCAFPEIYAGSVERMHSGASERELDRFICGEINQHGIPLENIEWMGHGIPLIATGIELSEAELYEAQPELIPLVALFGIRPEPGQYKVEVSDTSYTAGRIIADSLMKQQDERLKQVGWTIAWLFSCSGNSLVDYDEETLAEIQPLTWDEDDLAFAMELIEESDEIMGDVAAGLKLLQDNPILFTVMETNIQRTYKAIGKTKGKKDEPRVRLEWPSLVAGGDGTAVADSELLLVRCDAA